MSKGYVNNKILDGALGVSPAPATGIFGAVGVCAKPTGGIITLTTAADAKEKLVDGPLCDVIVQALSMASTTVYAVGLEGTTKGTIGQVAHAGTGKASVSASGSPRNDYEVIVTIEEGGLLNNAVAHITLDGVDQKHFTIPTGGTYEIPNTGITLTFTAAEESEFVTGDTYTFMTEAPKATNAEILAAVDKLLSSAYDFEWIAVAGVSDATLWAALDTKATEAMNNYRYIHFKCQGRYLDEDETVDDWVTALTGDERGTTVGGRIQVCAAWVECSDPYGAIDVRGALGWSCGMSAQKDVMEPVDHVGSSALSGILKLMPEGINDGHINALDNAGYLTLCQYIGLTGVYITHGRMFAEATSDFGLEERRRVMDLACKNVRIAQLSYINSTVAIGADGSAEGLDMFRAVTEQVLDNMVAAGQISGYEVEIDENQDLLSTETLRTRIRITPLGKMSFIENEISYNNPNLSGGNE